MHELQRRENPGLRPRSDYGAFRLSSLELPPSEFLQPEMSWRTTDWISCVWFKLMIWNQIRKTKPIWFFDATGDLCDNSFGKTLLYSIVCHDSFKKKIIPVADFFTASHNTLSISKYLLSIKSIINLSNSLLPSFIVTDFSWPLIHSVIDIFNKRSIMDYLNWSFDMIFKSPDDPNLWSLMPVKPYLCAAHFLKGISKKMQAVNVDKSQQKVFMFIFSLLQNCTNIQDFISILKLAYIIYLSPSSTQDVNNSLLRIKILLSTKRGVLDLFLELKKDKKPKAVADSTGLDKSDESLDTFCHGDIQETKQSLVNGSPFRHFFDDLLASFENEGTTMSTEMLPANPFYSKKLMSILTHYLYILPLWTGIILKKNILSVGSELQLIGSRLTNNYVENHFGHLKNNIFSKQIHLMPSQFILQMYNTLKSNFLLFYRQDSSNQADEDINMQPASSPVLAELREVWEKRKQSTFKREKGFFYKSNDIGIPNLNNIEQQLDFDQIFFNIENESQCLNLVQTLFLELQKQTDFMTITHLLEEHKQLLLQTLDILRLNLDRRHYLSHSYAIDTSFKPILELNGVSNEYFAIQTSPDGNCFYRSLSTLLFGNEKHFTVVKLCSLFTIVNSFPNIFKHILQRTQSVDSFELFVMKSFKAGEWASDYNILSAVLMLQTSIFCFSSRKISNKLDQHNIYYTWPDVFKENCRVSIAFNGSHFVPIVTLGPKFRKTSSFKSYKSLRQIYLIEPAADLLLLFIFIWDYFLISSHHKWKT